MHIMKNLRDMANKNVLILDKIGQLVILCVWHGQCSKIKKLRNLLLQNRSSFSVTAIVAELFYFGDF
jgi:hypothetical protein